MAVSCDIVGSHNMPPACFPRHRSDSGGASYLGQVWAAACEWRDSGNFQLESIPRLELQVELQPLILLSPQQHADIAS